MKLGDVMKRLALMELKNLSMVDGGAILTGSRADVIAAMNQSLAEIHTRFPLREKTLLIEQVMNITEYKLLAKYAWSRREDNDELHHFIMDSDDEPYTGDIIKILSLWDDEGELLPLNDISNPCSYFTPYADTLLVQRPVEGDVLSITYQALPDEIPYDAEDTLEFDLPRVMLGALAAHVGSQVYLALGTQEAIAKSQVLLNNYEMQCTQVQLSDALNTGVTGTGTKFHQRGFV